MSKRKSKLETAVEFAKANGILEVEVDGIKIKIPQAEALPVINGDELTQNEKDLIHQLTKSPFDDMTDEEIEYYHTDYYDVLQAKKKAHQEALESERQEREPNER